MICTKELLGYCLACMHGGRHVDFEHADQDDKIEYLKAAVDILLERVAKNA